MTDLHGSAVTREKTRPKVRRHPLALLIPREHGVWSMLLIALILPPAVLGTGGAAWWFAGAATVLFFARRPWEIWLLGTSAGPPAADARTLALLLTVPGLVLGGWGLLKSASPLTAGLAVVVAALAGLSAWMESQPRRGRGTAASRIAGTAGMGGFILLQEAAAFGRITAQGWSLTVLYLAFYLMSGLRVRSLVRARNVEGFRWIAFSVNAGLFAGATIAARAGWIPPLAPLSLLSGLIQAVRILRRDRTPVNTMRMGIGEILHSLGFVALLMAAYKLAGL